MNCSPRLSALSRCCSRRCVPAGGRSQNLVDGLQLQHLQDASVVHFLSCRPLHQGTGHSRRHPVPLPESYQHTCPDRPTRWGSTRAWVFLLKKATRHGQTLRAGLPEEVARHRERPPLKARGTLDCVGAVHSRAPRALHYGVCRTRQTSPSLGLFHPRSRDPN